MPRKQRFKPSRKPKPTIQDEPQVVAHQNLADPLAEPRAHERAFDVTDIETSK